MHPTMRTALLIAVNVLVPLAMVIFATGFFPYKPFLPGLAQYHSLHGRAVPDAPFNKVIFMVIDALRSDFVYSEESGFKFVQGQIRDGSAIPFTSNAQSPTVTMPRVKALTTGSIPSFLDMVLNIAESDTSSLATQDTWLAQMANKKTGMLTMWGDDTWLKLFPDTFGRADGTSSFFVSDFTEVDNNVTRHVPDELAKDDWSVMVMHYLGMDHIGHKSGPRSVNMHPKQVEMDGIAKVVVSALETQRHLESTLFVLCGDHGMNDGGNHGGSTPGETSPAMVFMSPKLRAVSSGFASPTNASSDFDYYAKIEQSDIAPTLAGLLGFPVPLNNLGVTIPEFLGLFSSDDDKMQLLMRNALQLLDIVEATFPHPSYGSRDFSMDCSDPSSATEDLACAWKRVTDRLPADETDPYIAEALQQPLLDFCHKAQSKLSSTASNYDAPRLYAGIGLGAMALVLSAVLIAPSISISATSSTIWLILTSIMYVVMMFASSYVEEEQQFWHWAAIAWAILPRHKLESNSLRASLVTAMCLRIMRRWNQSGQKFSGAPDIASDFLPRHPGVLLFLNVVAFSVAAEDVSLNALQRSGMDAISARVAGWTVSLSAFVFKLAFTFNDAPELFGPETVAQLAPVFASLPSLITLARIVYTLTLLSLIAVLILPHIAPRSSTHTTTTIIERIRPLMRIILHLQTRAVNIPVFLLLDIIELQLPALGILDAPQTALACTILSHASFFALGGTNGIGSVDLSHSYNGLSSYQPLLTALLCLVSNYAAPFATALMGRVHLVRQARRLQMPPHASKDVSEASGKAVRASPAADEERTSQATFVAHMSFFMAAMVFGVMAACCALRTHLFVWTVFSPKFLYAAAWFLGWHLLWNLGVCGALVALG